MGTRKHAGGGDGALEGDSGSVEGMRVGGVGWAKAEQVLGQRMERVATAWLEAIDQVSAGSDKKSVLPTRGPGLPLRGCAVVVCLP